ncbi:MULTISPECIES: C-GCAxxG-C-C family protein [Coprococcus]|jgi:C_GCAxxG_C_C family probable redox protein|uniref:C-GCAxxG-C-C family protein n=1 Tax=Coprococcus TaxID=33042 RepID=UPI000E4C866B|nr:MULTISPECIES: C-GCAxxG-C-C family protein [Coprococcus]RHU53783.1 C_GCAxxG_C_C family protein [Coprococcus sp. TF11-13]RJV47673.1 C_GCAxxG_C_C family protein [Coprococcus sp. AF19-8AC]
MNKHVEKAMEIRNETPMVNNCAQTILRAYADELGITGDMAAKLSANFGGGMKCGLTCGAITGGLMVLGALGVENPYVINQFRRRIADNHNGMTDCVDLLKANAQKGGIKKVHCDGMIREAIELIDELVESNEG